MIAWLDFEFDDFLGPIQRYPEDPSSEKGRDYRQEGGWGVKEVQETIKDWVPARMAGQEESLSYSPDSMDAGSLTPQGEHPSRDLRGER